MPAVPADTEELINEIHTITEVKLILTKIADQIRAEGKVEGKLEGEQAKAREDAGRMLDEGLDIQMICRVTGLTREEVESLREQ